MSITVLVLAITLETWAALGGMYAAAKLFDRFAPKSWTVMSDAAVARKYNRKATR